MAEFKLVMSTKDGKSHQKEIKSPESDYFFGKKIGDQISGDSIGFPGYEFELRGGSDSSGFPMRFDVVGPVRKKILAARSIGVKIKARGLRVRKSVAGNTVGQNIAQINLKVLKVGKEPLTPAQASEKAEEVAA